MPSPAKSAQAKFMRAVRALRRGAPAALPVRTRRARVASDELASCSLRVSGRVKWFDIRIRPEADLQERVQSLIHEWAHCLAWSDGHPTLTDHDEVWGVCYSKCYRAVFPDSE